MAKLSLAELKATVASYVTAAKISNATLSVVRTSTCDLVDKIGKIITLDTSYIDKLAMLDGDDLGGFGKTIEEWQEDLIMVENYDSTGANNNAPKSATYRPAFYSTTLGRKQFKATVYNNDFERAVHTEEQLSQLIVMRTKRLYDSEAVWKYDTKKELLNKFVTLIDAAKTGASSYAAATSYAVGSYIKDSTEYGIVVKAITGGASDTNTWAKCKSNGFVILLNMVNVLAKPTDASTGEAFVKQLKQDVEAASDISEGNSLNGNTLGATDGLLLICKQGVLPAIEVDVMSGAFHQDKVAIPAQTVVVNDFGNDSTNVYAMLIDSRAVRLFNTYRAVRDFMNADGDFINFVLHVEYTGHISRNCFVKVYRPA